MASRYAKNGKIRPYNTTIVDDGKTVRVILYNTVIFTWECNKSHCILNTGGYNTPTTIRRMNECLNFYGFAHRVVKSDFKTTKEIVCLNPF